ncbi:MAG: hypothetical protein NTW98_00585 [Candidatus Nomurabacteria bacterium]|nr:hypothetical protein [Candidatus Nomurabacteria bacterium]
MKVSILKLLILILGIFVVTPFIASAQVQSTDVTLSVTPKFPAPGGKVTATLSSYVTSLDRANMTWSVDGENMLSGIGKKSFSFTLGPIGSNTTLRVDIQTIDRQSLTKTVNLSATEIDMLWEATDSYVPPFYKGKALVSREGYFKVVAIPNISSAGGIINPVNLSYIWEKDDKGQPDMSGWGKNYFLFKNSYIDTNNEILVKVSDVFGNINTGNKINLQTATPKIVFYKQNLLMGIDLAHALNPGHLVDKQGETLVAVPYFFSPKDMSSSDLEFDWMINNKPAQNNGTKNQLGIKGTEGKTGQATVKVNITNTKTLFQSLIKELNVVF